MKQLHIFGLTIIGLVVAAFVNTPEFFIGINAVLKIKIILLIVFLISIAGTTIIHFWIKSILLPESVSRIIALCIWIISGSIFFLDTEYFYHGISLPLSFWHRVSFYTLPAIALESAIVTGFEYYRSVIQAQQKTVGRPVVYLFILYTLTTMLVNFLALGGSIPVDLHITIAQIVLITSFGILLAIFIQKKTPR